jgi:hypothetical protein
MLLLTRHLLELQLATPKRIVDLDWHIVCGRYEIDELQTYDMIKPWQPKDPRHSLFNTMKYPGQEFYQGEWGPEILYYDKEDNLTTGQLGKIHCTEARRQEIQQWFLDTMFNIAPGND